MTKGVTPQVPDDGLTTRQRRLQPIVAIHTGEGKGKTTAALGMALRAWAQGWNIGVYQFVKSATWRTGEQQAFAALPQVGDGQVTWERMGTGWSWLASNPSDDRQEAAKQGWLHVREGLAAQRHDFWLLDEFTYPLHWGWIDVDEVVAQLRDRPGRQHVVITGRNCPPELVAAADLVTSMTKIKHPFDKGQRGQAGIEW